MNPNIKDPIDLSSLVGEHILSGCDITTEQVLDWGESHISAGVIRFVLDGKTYEAIEDPSDGYRSYLEGLQLAPDGTAVKNTFPDRRVIASHRTVGKHGDQDDVLELRDVDSGDVILEVGTDSVDDYYPGCVMSFNP